MFTGLVREIGRLTAIRPRGAVTVLDIDAPRTAPSLGVGDSLAVNGICLTVTRRLGARVRVDASSETRRVTTLPTWRSGDRVHLEPALRAGEALGGHFVLGHVDGVGRVVRVRRGSGTAQLTIALAADLAGRLLPKGSVAVDGVSLTLDAGPFRDDFTVTIVPQTLGATRFDRLRHGDAVNLELDVLAKAVSARDWRAPRAATGSEQIRPTLERLTLASILDRGWSRTRSGGAHQGRGRE